MRPREGAVRAEASARKEEELRRGPGVVSWSLHSNPGSIS